MHRREAPPQLDGHDDQSDGAGRRAEEALLEVLRPEADEGGGGDGAATAAAAALGLVFATAFVVGVVLNTLLLVVYCRRRGFRSQISNRFLLNLVAANLFSCAFVTPFLLWDAVGLGHVSSVAACSAFTVVLVVSSSASMFSQLLIGVDQYLAVTEPLHYHRKITKPRCRVLCAASWLFSCCMGFLGLISEARTGGGGVAYGDPGVPSHLKMCRTAAAAAGWNAPSALAYFCLAFGAPFLALLYVYARVFCAAHANSVKTRRNSVCSASFDHLQQHQQQQQLAAPYYGYRSKHLGVTQPPQQQQQQPQQEQLPKRNRLSVVGHNVTLTVRHKLSTASALIPYREEGRAAKATVLVLLMIVVCWGPHFAVLMVETDASYEVPESVDSVALALVAMSPVLSPVLYAFRSRRVQRDMRRVLGLPNSFAASAIAGMKSDTHLLHRKAGVRIQRMKSFSCPQLLISSPEVPPIPDPASSTGSTASTSLSTSPTTTAAAAAAPMSSVLPRRIISRIPGKTGKSEKIREIIPGKQQRKFGFIILPDNRFYQSPVPAAAEACPMLSGGGTSPDIHL